MPFVPEVFDLRPYPDGTWELRETVRYVGRDETWELEEGMKSDLASVPAALRWLMNTYGRYTRAALLHDKLWSEHRAGRLASRRDADGLFRRVMREDGVPFLQRWLMWAAVRIGDLFEGGMSGKEWAAFAALMVPGAIVGLVSLPPLVVRGLIRLPSWLAGL